MQDDKATARHAYELVRQTVAADVIAAAAKACLEKERATARERNRKPWFKKAANWLRGQDWSGLEPAKPAKPTVACVKVLRNSPQGEAWVAWHKKRGDKGRWAIHKYFTAGEFVEDGEWPPDSAEPEARP